METIIKTNLDKTKFLQNPSKSTTEPILVTKPVLPYALIVGNPGKQIGWVSKYGNKLDFSKNNIGICKESGLKYKLEHNIITPL